MADMTPKKHPMPEQAPEVRNKKTQVYISEELAAPFECWEKVGY